ncbi:MAG: hypothetical protein NTW95_04845 [Candidatus Aminicenantes bacterium]|nr:hypothetical protein [Candidatus Aminicenantes bacterium]
MKKEKMVKIGLIAMTVMILLLGTTCKKSDESENDINVIIGLATQSISDINNFAASTANIGNHKAFGVEKQAAGPCIFYMDNHPISQAIRNVENPSPGHGWMTGLWKYWFYSDCSAYMEIEATWDCSQGATMTTGDTLGGSLLITGHINAASGVVDMFMTEESNSFSVNNRSHIVYLILEATGTLSGGTVTITGHIDSDEISITSSY